MIKLTEVESIIKELSDGLLHFQIKYGSTVRSCMPNLYRIELHIVNSLGDSYITFIQSWENHLEYINVYDEGAVFNNLENEISKNILRYIAFGKTYNNTHPIKIISFKDAIEDTKNKMKMKNSKVIAVDFDGTCVTHDFPKIGRDIGAIEVLKELTDRGHRIILFTMRSNNQAHPNVLKEAIDWFKNHGIPLYGVNNNPEQYTWTNSPKPYAHIYIDDAGLGVPLKEDGSISDRPFVDWDKVRVRLKNMEIL